MTTTAFVALIDLSNLSNLTVQFAAEHPENTDLYTAGSAPELEDLTGPQAVALYNTLAAELSPFLPDQIVPVKRFADKGTATKRVWDLIVKYQDHVTRQAAAQRPIVPVEDKPQALTAEDKKAIKEAKNIPAPKAAARKTAGINLAPRKKVYACREGSKQATLVDLLSRSCGASMTELLAGLAFGAKAWKEVTVKSGLNWDMNKIKGYGIRTEFQNGYERWLEGDYDNMGDFTSEQHPDEADHEATLAANVAKGFDPSKRTVAVYFLVLPEGMTAPVPHTPKKGA